MTNAITTVFDRLSSAGIDRAYVRSTVLPSWWNDELAESPGGFAETLMIVGSRLGVAPSELRGERPLSLEPSRNQRFYLSAATDRDQVVVAQRVAFQAARIVARGITSPIAQLPRSAAELRAALLATGIPWIDLEALLAFCWRSGIAVLHVGKLPSGKKMTALAGYVDDRPVIILCHRRKSSWLLFHLAHEIGHLASGHVQPGGLLADEGIDDASTDEDEKQANAYAFELLGGSPPARLPSQLGWKAATLASRARNLGEERRVDPGHLALVYAKQVQRIALGSAALNVLDAESDAVACVHEHARRCVDWSKLSEDETEFAGRVMGVDLDP